MGKHTRGHRKGPAATEAEIIAALYKHGGIVAKAAIELDYRKSTLKEYVRKSDVLRKFRDDFQDDMLDEAEYGLLQKVKAGHFHAIKYALSTIGRKRGYSERVELTGAKGKDLFPELTPVQKELLKERGVSASEVMNDFFAELNSREPAVDIDQGGVEDGT